VVQELVPVRRGGGSRVEGLADAPVMRVRGRLVPLVFLDAFLGLREETACREEGTVVLVRVDDREFGIVVDGSCRTGQAGQTCRDLLESASLTTIVIKPIGSVLAGLGVYSGGTVLGDGGLVLILDLRGLCRLAGVPPLVREELPLAGPGEDSADRYLVCRTGAGRRVAVPLEKIVRLEKYRAADVQTAGPRRLVRRGDGFTPLADADALLAAASPPPATVDPSLNVVVIRDDTGDRGIAVAGIIDVLAAESPLQPSLATTGVSGTVALGGRATEVLDLPAVAAVS
jgi:two-component system, chemotaxis family, sensor kinase CheA